MNAEFDDGTLLLRDAPETIPYAEWDDPSTSIVPTPISGRKRAIENFSLGHPTIRGAAESVTPQFIDTDDERYRKTARELLQLFEDHLGEPRGELDDAIDRLTVADTDYEIVQGLAKLIRDESEFETVAATEPQTIRRRLFERANEQYPIVRQPTLREDTRKLDVYSAVADELGLTLEECYQGMYADLEANKRLVTLGTRTADAYSTGDGEKSGTTTTQSTSTSDEKYEDNPVNC